MSKGLCVNCVKNNACIFRTTVRVMFCGEHEIGNEPKPEQQPPYYKSNSFTPRSGYRSTLKTNGSINQVSGF